MTVTIFGASGRTGIDLIKECLGNNFNVVAFARSKTKLDNFKDKIKIIEGSVFNFEDVNNAIKNSNCVISVLGHSKDTPYNMQTEAIKNIISSMHQNNVSRLITLTGAGVFVEGDKPTIIDNAITVMLKLVSKNRVEDGINFVEQIKKSNLNWTVLRAPILNNKPATNNIKLTMVGDNSVKFSISRKDIAKTFIKIINQSSTFKTLPFIAENK